MTPFGFILHPLDARRDVARRYPIARYLPLPLIEYLLKLKKPQVLSEITGIRSLTGAETRGWFVGVPLTPRMMRDLPLEFVYDRILHACELARRQGAQIVGLGAFTAVVGDGGITIHQRSPIPVTTGNSYTVATAVEGTLKAANLMGIPTKEATLAVVGATGSIGRTCAILLAPSFAKVILVGRDWARTEKVAEEVGGIPSITITDISQADVVITVTSAETAIIQPEHLKTGAVVCDVARPRDVSRRVAEERPDVLVLEGGIVEVPGDVNFGFDFGFPPRMAYACMAETMILALENRPEPFTLGKKVSVAQVEEIRRLAEKHGFRLAGFRSFEKPVSEETIQRVRRLAEQRRTSERAKTLT
jgi:fatty aldehyde-generating acyl-ACP reductase